MFSLYLLILLSLIPVLIVEKKKKKTCLGGFFTLPSFPPLPLSTTFSTHSGGETEKKKRMSGEWSADATAKSKVDSALSTRTAVAQLYCNQKKLQADAALIEVDVVNVRVLMRKYGAENFVDGEASMLEEGERLRRKLAKVSTHIESMEDNFTANVTYAAALHDVRRTTSPARMATRSTSPPPVSEAPLPGDIHISHRMPTVSDSRILSNSAAFMSQQKY